MEFRTTNHIVENTICSCNTARLGPLLHVDWLAHYYVGTVNYKFNKESVECPSLGQVWEQDYGVPYHTLVYHGLL